MTAQVLPLLPRCPCGEMPKVYERKHVKFTAMVGCQCGRGTLWYRTPGLAALSWKAHVAGRAQHTS